MSNVVFDYSALSDAKSYAKRLLPVGDVWIPIKMESKETFITS